MRSKSAQNTLKDLRKRHLSGRTGGQLAVCSAHPLVLQAAAGRARQDGALLLVEATANQVNLAGGYTGMTPADFSARMSRLASENKLPPKQIVLGADHLGLHLWRHLPSYDAMARAEALTRAFVSAGYQKLHLDTGMGCANDPPGRLPVEIAAQRAAALCRDAEAAARDAGTPPPLYVIGTEAPAPGGALQENNAIAITDPISLNEELEQYRIAFRQAGADQAWDRVLATVVQPGVDFDDEHSAPYEPEAAAALSAFHDRLPGAMTFEIHAADYQSGGALKQMVRDHFCLIKIGPCLTSALREALFALARIEDELPAIAPKSNLIKVMDQLMVDHPEHWSAYYHGAHHELHRLFHHSLRDRIRYYWPHPEARRACDLLIRNLQGTIPRTLIRQFFPELADAIDSGALPFSPLSVIQNRIQLALNPYVEACNPSSEVG